jgi:hypothetical protein
MKLISIEAGNKEDLDSLMDMLIGEHGVNGVLNSLAGFDSRERERSRRASVSTALRLAHAKKKAAKNGRKGSKKSSKKSAKKSGQVESEA